MVQNRESQPHKQCNAPTRSTRAAKALFVFCLLYTPQNTANLSYEERSLLFKLFRFFTSSYLASAKVISFTSTASLPST